VEGLGLAVVVHDQSAHVTPFLDRLSTISLVLLILLISIVNFDKVVRVFGTRGILAGNECDGNRYCEAETHRLRDELALRKSESNQVEDETLADAASQVTSRPTNTNISRCSNALAALRHVAEVLSSDRSTRPTSGWSSRTKGPKAPHQEIANQRNGSAPYFLISHREWSRVASRDHAPR
jgi:hypothetical protein